MCCAHCSHATRSPCRQRLFSPTPHTLFTCLLKIPATYFNSWKYSLHEPRKLSLILSVFCRTVPVLSVLLCTPWLPLMFSWLGLLWRMALYPWVSVSSGLVHRSLRPLALPPVSRVAGCCPPDVAPLGVLRPKPVRGRAWSPICFFFYARIP
jgi:hypothetical protein